MDTQRLVIQEIFQETAKRFPEKVALQSKKDSGWQKLTYQELDGLALRIARFLINEGFQKGGPVGIILENRPEWVQIFLGVMYAGLIAVPLDPALSQQELKNLLLDSGARIIFCSHDTFAKKVSPELHGQLAKIIILDSPVTRPEDLVSFSEIGAAATADAVLPKVEPQDVALLFYTSGTTGTPKGVLLTHKNICSNFFSIKQTGIYFSSDNTLSILPFYHTYAFMATLIVPLLMGSKITFLGLSFKPQELIQVIKETEITLLVGVPHFFVLIHKAMLERLKKIPFILRPFFKIGLGRYLGRSLRFMASGGARLDPRVCRDLNRWGVKLIEGYGLTETSPVVTLNPLQKIKYGSAGKALPDVQVKIISPDKSGIGRVAVRGANVMQGYFKQPELTAQVIKDGWFYTKDLGYLDKEGYLFLTGREEELIVLSSGKNIYPEELEAYYGVSPYIKEMCILEKFEEKFGHRMESLHAVIVPNLEYFRSRNEANIREKIRWELDNLSRNLPAYAHIMGFTVTKDGFVRTALGKIKRFEVRQRYLEVKAPKAKTQEAAFSEEDSRLLEEPAAQKIIKYISAELKKSAYLDSHLELDLGIDSLTRVELGLGLENLFSLKIPEDILYSVSTVKEVILRIRELINQPTQAGLGAAKSGALATPIWPGAGPIKTWSQILEELPSGETLEKIKIEPSFPNKLATWAFKVFFLSIFKIFWLLGTEGKENLPKDGPYLICPNHASYLDGLIIFSSLPLNLALKTYFIGYSAIFEHPLIRWAIKASRLIPIDPNVNLTQALQAVAFVLRQKRIACIFPEGMRAIDEQVGEFKKGIGVLIKELDIPVVPVYIKGSHRSWPRTFRFPRLCRIKVIFGKPCTWKELKQENQEAAADDYEAIAKALRQMVMRLVC